MFSLCTFRKCIRLQNHVEREKVLAILQSAYENNNPISFYEDLDENWYGCQILRPWVAGQGPKIHWLLKDSNIKAVEYDWERFLWQAIPEEHHESWKKMPIFFLNQTSKNQTSKNKRN